MKQIYMPNQGKENFYPASREEIQEKLEGQCSNQELNTSADSLGMVSIKNKPKR